jgi:hypothetical protein
MIKIDAGNSSGSRSSTRSASAGVTWPLANMVVLLTGLDSLGSRDQGPELVLPTPLGAAGEYLLTRWQMLGKGAPD